LDGGLDKILMLYFSAVNRFTTRVIKLNQLLIQNSIIMKKKVFITIVLALFVGASTNLKGQTTFERMIPIEGCSVELPGPECVVAGDGGYIVNVPLGIWNTILYDYRILKLSTDGDIINELNYSVVGERVVCYWQIVKLSLGNSNEQNHYLAVGGLCDPHDDVVNTTLTDILFLVFNEELEVEYERVEDVSEIVEHYSTWGRPRVVFDNDGNLVVATFAKVIGGELKRVYTHVELDKTNWIGEITHFVKESPEDVGWIWDFFPLSDGTYRQIEEVNMTGGIGYRINSDFEAEKILEFRDIRFHRGNFTFSPNLLDCGGHTLLNDSTLFIPAIMRDASTDGIGTMELTVDFDTIKAHILDFADSDTMERIFSRHPLIHREDNLNMCYTRDMHNWHPSQASYTVLCKYDTDLNLIWKRWYRDTERQFCYYATDMVASNDGGILITGYCCKREDYGNMMLYLLKVDADGLLSLPEAEVQVRPYCFYPNPVKTQLQMQFSPDVQPKQVELYDLQGRLVHVQRNDFRSIDMGQLPAGTYMLRVALEDGKTYSDKVVKD
jgi:hypothetical protein